MNKTLKNNTKKIGLLLLSLLIIIPYIQSRGGGRHGRGGGGHHHGGGRRRGYYGGGWGWGGGLGYTYPYGGYGYNLGYGYPYGYGWGPTLGIGFSSSSRPQRKENRVYHVTNKTNRMLRVATTQESKRVQPGDRVNLEYSEKTLTISSDNPRERTKIRPLSEAITIVESEGGRLNIED